MIYDKNLIQAQRELRQEYTDEFELRFEQPLSQYWSHDTGLDLTAIRHWLLDPEIADVPIWDAVEMQFNQETRDFLTWLMICSIEVLAEWIRKEGKTNGNREQLGQETQERA